MKKSQAQPEWYSGGLKFSCTQCGRCCTGPPGYVWFSPEEARDIADYLNINEDKFLQSYAHQIKGRWSLNEIQRGREHDCVFLARTPQGQATCSIYSVRPTQCRTWPFWPENLSTPTQWRRVARSCPGVNQGQLYGVEQIRIIRDRNPKD